MAVDELEIEGFKPLKSLKFDEDDLGMVNVITGRNNTGKSSILEAIDLLYNPAYVDRFTPHVGDLINKDKEDCVISDEERDLIIRSANRKAVLEYYRQAILENLSTIIKYYIPRNIERTYETTGGQKKADMLFENRGHPDELIESNEEKQEYAEMIRQIANEEALDEETISFMEKNLLIIETNEGAYPYFSRTTGYSERLSELITTIIKKSISKKLDEVSTDELHIDTSYIDASYFHSREGFLLDKPTNSKQAKLIKDDIEYIPNYEPDGEGEAIKIDDIEDYITERGLVDNLKDFDLDYLVFKEDGEKDSVPFDFMGDGFKSMVGILWELIEDDESEIVMIEEPENHMHPGYVQEMFDFLVTMAREDDVQLFITTHSIDFINYMFDENLPEEHREFLEDELSVIRMESPELAAVFDYEEAKKNSEELHLDLRGI